MLRWAEPDVLQETIEVIRPMFQRLRRVLQFLCLPWVLNVANKSVKHKPGPCVSLSRTYPTAEVQVRTPRPVSARKRRA